MVLKQNLKEVLNKHIMILEKGMNVKFMANGVIKNGVIETIYKYSTKVRASTTDTCVVPNDLLIKHTER